MADYTFLKQSDGQWLKVLVDSSGIIQASPNADDSDLASVLAGAATSADTADAPTDATTFTAALDLATTALPGLESTADKAIINGVTAGAWAGARAAEMLVAVPEITEFKFIDPTIYGPSATAPTFDGSTEGGAVSPLSNASEIFLARTLAQTVKTGKGAITFRAKILTPSTSFVVWLGLSNVGETHVVSILREDNATDTHYQIQAIGAGTTKTPGTVVADTNWHNFMMAWNGTNVRLFIDGALAATLASLSNVNDEAMAPFMYNSETTKVYVSKILYGYIPV